MGGGGKGALMYNNVGSFWLAFTSQNHKPIGRCGAKFELQIFFKFEFSLCYVRDPLMEAMFIQSIM